MMSPYLFLLFFIVAISAAGLDDDKLLLNHATFLMTHNAATGEDNGNISPDVDNQAVPIAEQLECGARALDYRPFLQSNGNLIARHGVARIHVLMRDSVQSILSWLQEHPTEFVILYLSHAGADGPFSSSDAYSFAETLLDELGVHWIRNCNDLVGLTVGQAKRDSELPGGSGHLLGLFGCTDEQYDSSIQCYVGSHDCTQGDSLPFAQFDTYMDAHTNFPNAASVTNGRMYMSQAHWHYGGLDLFLQSDSIISDEAKSGLNARVAHKVAQGEYNFLNFLQVDNVCNKGEKLEAAVAQFMSPNPQVNCLSNNHRLRVNEYIESDNGLYQAQLRASDGQLCIYDNSGSVEHWCSGTPAPSSAGGAGICKMTRTGNLIMYTPTDQPYFWLSGNDDHLALVLLNNRDLVLRKETTGQVVWSCSKDASNACSTVACSGSNCGNDACRNKNQSRPAPTPTPPPPPPPPTQKPVCFLWFCW